MRGWYGKHKWDTRQSQRAQTITCDDTEFQDEDVKYQQLYRETFNKTCLMVQPKPMEVQEIKPLTLLEFSMKKFESLYLSVPTKGRRGPFFISLAHDDRDGKGMFVYLSTSCPYPSAENFEQHAFLTDEQSA